MHLIFKKKFCFMISYSCNINTLCQLFVLYSPNIIYIGFYSDSIINLFIPKTIFHSAISDQLFLSVDVFTQVYFFIFIYFIF